MIEYRIQWCECPTNYHTSRVLYVEAATAIDARAIAVDHIERNYSIGWFTITSVDEVKPLPPGRVLSK